jgi:3-oxoacyl-[acyl-carrier-protein] synthase-3
MTNEVYINRLAAFLPGEPVSNERMEQVLGLVGGRRSRARSVILRSNGIKSRHYAIDPETGQLRYNNAQLTAEAVRALAGGGFDPSQIDLLACGTSTPDQLLPSHAAMVHGELKTPPCEIAGAAGVCVSGMTAFKYAYMAVRAELARNAVATGSELISTFMLGRSFEKESEAKLAELESRGELAFEKDFLRWMLSDGAGAVLLQGTPNAHGRSLRVDWIEQVSFANELDVCMYSGGEKRADGTLQGWREYEDPEQILKQSLFAVKQDVRLLNAHIIRTTVEQGLALVRQRRGIRPGDYAYFLPHYSSGYFRDRVYQGLRNIDFDLPQERWFTNLTSKGNTGSASIYIMLEELFAGGRLEPGQRLLCYIPESGRFSVAYMQLTVV